MRGNGHLEVIPFQPNRAWWVQVVLLVWRWLAELVAVVLLTFALVGVHDAYQLTWTVCLLLVGGLLCAPLVFPVTRRAVMAMVWVLVTRHRLRAFFTQCWVINRSGRLPWIIAIRPTRVGERVWLWLVPGINPTDIDARRDDIASSCWAADARITRSRRIATLVTLDVIRRDPLIGSRPIPSHLVPDTLDIGSPSPADRDEAAQIIDLTQLSPRYTASAPKTSQESRADTPASSASGRTRTKTRQPIPPTTTGDEPRFVIGGEDVTDYV
jgi:hypothetical protein